jgi:hypothetical protein
MRRCVIINYLISFLVMAVAFPVSLLCQNDTLTVKGLALSAQNKSDEGIHSLYAGIGGGTNLIYLGTSISNNKPFYSAALTYGYKSKLFVSGSATHLSETSPYMAFCNLSVNYSHTFNSWFDISADIAGYKSAESLKDSLFADFAYLSLTTGFDWKLLYTRISFSELVSEENGFYLQVSNSHYFETPGFFNGKALISFDPAIDVLCGNLITIESVTGSTNNGKAPPFSHAKRKPIDSSYSYSEKFGFMDMQFSLPVTFSYGRFSLEAEPSYLLPLYSDGYYPEPEGFTFYLNALYKIF